MQKALVLYDIENQSDAIYDLKDWNLNYDFEFEGYGIKSFSEDPILGDYDLYIILIGASTRYLDQRFYKDVEQIIAVLKPILCLNLNGFVALEEDTCPKLLHDAGAIHMPFTMDDLIFSLQSIKPDTRIVNPKGSYHLRRFQRPFNE